MSKGFYQPVSDSIPGNDIQKCITRCSMEAQAELDQILNIFMAKCKKQRLGRKGALELLGRLVQLGLIGPGPVDPNWLARIRIR